MRRRPSKPRTLLHLQSAVLTDDEGEIWDWLDVEGATWPRLLREFVMLGPIRLRLALVGLRRRGVVARVESENSDVRYVPLTFRPLP